MSYMKRLLDDIFDEIDKKNPTADEIADKFKIPLDMAFSAIERYEETYGK